MITATEWIEKWLQILEVIPTEKVVQFRQKLAQMYPTENASVNWKMSGTVFEEENEFLNSTYLEISEITNPPEKLELPQILERLFSLTSLEELEKVNQELEKVKENTLPPYDFRFSPCIRLENATILHFNFIGSLTPENQPYVV